MRSLQDYTNEQIRYKNFSEEVRLVKETKAGTRYSKYSCTNKNGVTFYEVPGLVGLKGSAVMGYVNGDRARPVIIGPATKSTIVKSSFMDVIWTTRTSAADNWWLGIAYGNGLFVAVASTGSGNRVMTSPDGITWTTRTSAADNWWWGIAYGNGLFVAVSASGTGNRVMTSPDGITWTTRTSAADNDWRGIAYGNGLFAAVAITGTGNRSMTSPDGITWTIRTSAADNWWQAVTFGNGMFVAVSSTGTGNRVMTAQW